MEITRYRPDMLPDLTEMVNTHVCCVPPWWELTPEQVEAIMQMPSRWGLHYPEPQRFAVRETTCVLEEGKLVAAAEWGRPDRDDPRWGIEYRDMLHVFWFASSPRSGDGMEALLAILTDHARALGCTTVDASGRYAFGVGWLGIPILLPHLIDGFDRWGFEPYERWVIMAGDTDAAARTAPANGKALRLEWQVNEDALEWELKAFDGETLAGECDAWGIPPQFADCKGYGEWITLEWGGVEKAYRRQGIGRYLIREQMRRQAERGVKHAMLWVEPSNEAARKMCESVGFEYQVECWRLQKHLD